MSDFLYYVPNERIKSQTGKPTIEEIRAFGLGHVFDIAPSPRAVLGGGPDTMQGQLLFATEGAGRGKYDCERQTWHQIGDCVWMGWWDDSPPTPDDLARDHQLPGEWVRFANGTNWLIPCARRYSRPDGAPDSDLSWSCVLPRVVEYESGKWFAGGVESQYENLWTYAEEYEAAMYAGTIDPATGMISFEYDHIVDFAVAGVSVNYRVGPHELSKLKLLNQTTYQRIIEVLRDEKTWREWAKKKVQEAPAGGDSLNGQEQSIADNPADIGRPSRTSEHGNRDGIVNSSWTEGADEVAEPETVEVV